MLEGCGIYDGDMNETGTSVVEAEALGAVCPWQNAAWWLRPVAFWVTVWRVTWKPDAVSESKHSADTSDAVLPGAGALGFRCCLWLWLWLGSLAAVFLLLGDDTDWEEFFEEWFSIGGTWVPFGMGVLAVGYGLGVFAVTGAHRYWFGPKRLPENRRFRAVTLSTYAAAPMAWIPFGVVFAWLARWLPEAVFYQDTDWTLRFEAVLYTLGAVLVFFALWRSFWAMHVWLGRLADRRGAARLLAVASVPALWFGCLLLLGLLLPMVVGYGALMVWLLVNG